MIPDNPNWSSLTDVKAYPIPDFIKPPALGVVHDISLGPIALNDSQGKLNSRYWVVYQEAGKVNISGAIDGEWQPATVVFTEPTEITKISLTFDQLGRPLVFYNTDTSDLKLYWYNHVTETNEVKSLGIGYDPAACFDWPQDTSQSFSDMLVFYVRGQQVYMRIQRDRFDIEYSCPANQPGITITSAGLRVDNRLQVVYQHEAGDYVPPIVPVPPIVVDGKYGYKMMREMSLVAGSPLIADRYNFKAGFDIQGYAHSSSMPVAVLLSQGANIRPLSFISGSIFYPTTLAVLLYKTTEASNGTIVVIISNREHFFPLPSPLGDGAYEIKVQSGIFTLTRNSSEVVRGLIVPAVYINDNGPLCFGAPLRRYNDQLITIPIGIEATFTRCWVDTVAGRLNWNFASPNIADQPSSPSGNNAEIYNHRPQNWKFIAS